MVHFSNRRLYDSACYKLDPKSVPETPKSTLMDYLKSITPVDKARFLQLDWKMNINHEKLDQMINHLLMPVTNVTNQELLI